jgi:hypothetical protein
LIDFEEYLKDYLASYYFRVIHSKNYFDFAFLEFTDEDLKYLISNFSFTNDQFNYFKHLNSNSLTYFSLFTIDYFEY